MQPVNHLVKTGFGTTQCRLHSHTPPNYIGLHENNLKTSNIYKMYNIYKRTYADICKLHQIKIVYFQGPFLNAIGCSGAD